MLFFDDLNTLDYQAESTVRKKNDLKLHPGKKNPCPMVCKWVFLHVFLKVFLLFFVGINGKGIFQLLTNPNKIELNNYDSCLVSP